MKVVNICSALETGRDINIRLLRMSAQYVHHSSHYTTVNTMIQFDFDYELFCIIIDSSCFSQFVRVAE